MQMINEIQYSCTRSTVEEKWALRPLTDTEWYIVMGQMESLIETYLENDMPWTIEELPTLVEEHNKRNAD